MMRLTINLVLFMGIACAGASSAGLIETGVWGGEHVRLTVRASGADIEFDCAHGRVEEPIILDDAKHFDARGVFVRERGGPVREGEVEDAKPARYQGTVKGDAATTSGSSRSPGVPAGVSSSACRALRHYEWTCRSLPPGRDRLRGAFEDGQCLDVERGREHIERFEGDRLVSERCEAEDVAR